MMIMMMPVVVVTMMMKTTTMMKTIADSSRGESSGAVDALGIPGWDKVDALSRALINCSGLSVNNEEAKNIETLYRALDDFDNYDNYDNYVNC